MSNTLDEDRIKALAYTLRNSGVMPLSTRDALRELTERWEKEDMGAPDESQEPLADENARLRHDKMLMARAWKEEVQQLKNELALTKASAEAAGSMLLDVQKLLRVYSTCVDNTGRKGSQDV